MYFVGALPYSTHLIDTGEGERKLEHRKNKFLDMLEKEKKK